MKSDVIRQIVALLLESEAKSYKIISSYCTGIVYSLSLGQNYSEASYFFRYSGLCESNVEGTCILL